MESPYLLLAGLFVALLLTWRFLTGSARERRHEKRVAIDAKARARPKPVQKTCTSYRGYEFRVGPGACAAARELRGKVFLAGRTPALPLAACSNTCQCKFEQRDDRRSSRDRRHPAARLGVAADAMMMTDGRSGRDRRRRIEFEGIY